MIDNINIINIDGENNINLNLDLPIYINKNTGLDTTLNIYDLTIKENQNIKDDNFIEFISLFPKIVKNKHLIVFINFNSFERAIRTCVTEVVNKAAKSNRHIILNNKNLLESVIYEYLDKQNNRIYYSSDSELENNTEEKLKDFLLKHFSDRYKPYQDPCYFAILILMSYIDKK